MPSLYEGFSLPAIEAMCTGICLVATDGGALPEVTGRDGETVLQCKAGDVDALAAAIRARPRRRRAARPRRRRRSPAGASSGGAGSTAPQLTVEQYREVLAMPHNVAKLRENGRI